MCGFSPGWSLSQVGLTVAPVGTPGRVFVNCMSSVCRGLATAALAVTRMPPTTSAMERPSSAGRLIDRLQRALPCCFAS